MTKDEVPNASLPVFYSKTSCCLGIQLPEVEDWDQERMNPHNQKGNGQQPIAPLKHMQSSVCSTQRYWRELAEVFTKHFQSFPSSPD